MSGVGTETGRKAAEQRVGGPVYGQREWRCSTKHPTVHEAWRTLVPSPDRGRVWARLGSHRDSDVLEYWLREVHRVQVEIS